MPFQKGHAKFGGKKIGSPGIRRTALEILESLHCNPIEGMVLIAQDPQTKPELRARMFAELARYGWPQLRAIEISGTGPSGSINLNVSGTELLASRIDSIAERTTETPDPTGTI